MKNSKLRISGSQMQGKKLRIDINKRTYEFALRIVKFVQRMPRNIVAKELGSQLLRSGTSIATNVEEAQGAFSKNDFVYKMSTAFKESKESNLWLMKNFQFLILNYE